eukprot:228971-Pelagomonas_calceolata.AAC.1
MRPTWHSSCATIGISSQGALPPLGGPRAAKLRSQQTVALSEVTMAASYRRLPDEAMTKEFLYYKHSRGV